jgi:SpoIID/LytB domain protein
MSAHAPHPSIRKWSPALGAEPGVRVGIVLEEDAASTLRIRLPQHPYAGEGGAALPAQLPPEALVTVTAGDAGMNVKVNDGPSLPAAAVRLTPAAPLALQRGAGACVHDVVAGRGFHWQKRLDQTLTGGLAVWQGRGGLILVNELPLEEYLCGVITAEMGADCPLDLLKAQCIVARSWLLALTEPKHDDDPFDRCNDDCCQRYQGTGQLSPAALEAVQSTRGVVLLDDRGDVVDANYSKSCGGISEPPELVWGKVKPGLSSIVDAPAGSAARRFPPVTEANLDEYLDGAWLADTDVFCSPNVVPEDSFGAYLGRVDEKASYFRWTVRYERAELEEVLRRRLPEAAELTRLHELRVLSRGPSGRVHQLEFVFLDTQGATRRVQLMSEYAIRAALHAGFLFSSAFAIRVERAADGSPGTITLRGAGWGHGAGLCQIGALGMALRKYPYDQICLHYFPGARLGKVYG